MVIASLVHIALAASTPSVSAFLCIATVEVTQSGVLSRKEGYNVDYCKHFQPNAKRVLAWFKAARRVPVAATVEADRSPCVALGLLHTLDG